MASVHELAGVARPFVRFSARALLAVVGLIGACAEPTTEVIVVVEAERPLDVRALRLRVISGADPSELTIAEGDPGWTGLPAVLQVRRAIHQEFRVEAIGTLVDDAQVRAGAQVSFADEARRMVYVRLRGECFCEEGCAACDAADAACCDLALESELYDPDAVVRDPGDPCHDNVRNGLETDTDCGGRFCEACVDGDSCALDADCVSALCGSRGECLPATCANGSLDDSETDVDCGGPSCDSCEVGASCVYDSHCESGVCQESTCRPTHCGDGELSGDESDVDCGGSCERCLSGAACGNESDCYTRLCEELACADGCRTAWGTSCPDVAVHHLLGPEGARHFGVAVAIVGSEIAVGAPDTAEVWLHAIEGGELVRSGTLTQGAGSRFGSALAVEGEVLVVGAPLESYSDLDEVGAAYVYRRSGATWTMEQRLTPPVEWVEKIEFGASVAIHGDWLIVGATRPNDDTPPGQAFLFHRVDGVWEAADILTATNGRAEDFFGNAVAFMGDDVVLVASEQNSSGGLSAGAVFAYHFDGLSWTLEEMLLPENPTLYLKFGRSLAVSGERLLVGGDGDDGPVKTGVAYFFERDSAGTWVRGQEITAHNADEADRFGRSVALRGGVAIVGANEEDGPGTGFEPDADGNTADGLQSGAAYVFVEDPTLGWIEVLYLKAPIQQRTAYFGAAMAYDGTFLVIAASDDDGSGTSVTVYELVP